MTPFLWCRVRGTRKELSAACCRIALSKSISRAAPGALLARRQRRAQPLKARPAHAGPRHSAHDDQGSSYGMQAGAGHCHRPWLPIVQFAATASMALPAGRVACDRLRRPLTRRPLPRSSAPARAMAEPGLTVPMAQAQRPGRAHCPVFFVRSPHDLHPISTYLPVAQGRGAYGRLWTPPQPHRPGSQDRQERRCDKATEVEVLSGPS